MSMTLVKSLVVFCLIILFGTMLMGCTTAPKMANGKHLVLFPSEHRVFFGTAALAAIPHYCDAPENEGILWTSYDEYKGCRFLTKEEHDQIFFGYSVGPGAELVGDALIAAGIGAAGHMASKAVGSTNVMSQTQTITTAPMSPVKVK